MPLMRILLALIFGSMVLGSRVDAGPEKVSAPDGCPTITHVPLVTVVRGDPATVVAKIECATGTMLDVQAYVRVLDAGPGAVGPAPLPQPETPKAAKAKVVRNTARNARERGRMRAS